MHTEALAALLESYVDSQVETAVRPVREAHELAVRERDQARGLLDESRADALQAWAARDAVAAELAACRASHQPAPRRMLIGTATAPSGGSTEQRVAFVKKFQAELAAAGGTLSFVHTFSGGTIPALGAGSPDNAVAKAFPGLSVMLNVKTPGGDWAGVPSGKYRAQWRALLDSALAWVKQHGGWVLLTSDHEPENDGKNAAEWRAAQVWYATEFYAHPIAQEPGCDYVFVLMAYTPEPASGRRMADWDVYPLLPAGIRDRPLLGWDVYFKAQDTVAVNWDKRARPAFDWSAQQGRRVVVFEWAVNNDAMVSEEQRGAVVAGILERFEEAGVEAAAYYPHPGPAAGTNPGPGPAGIKALAAASR